MDDIEHITTLIQKWYERKAWAEKLLLEKLNVADLDEIFGEGEIPGTEWKFLRHGIGVSVHKLPGQTGGIDFDFDKPNPDELRLSEFARRQVDEGAMRLDLYETVFKSWAKLRESMSRLSAYRQGPN